MKYLFTLLLAAVFSSAAFSQSEVKIGKQVWMTKNLDVDRFRNGDLIPEVTSEAQWIEYGRLRKPAWCYYDNKPENGKKYGKLYNGYAVNDSRGLAPKGWRIPTYSDFELLKTNQIWIISRGGGDENRLPSIYSNPENDDPFRTKSGWGWGHYIKGKDSYYNTRGRNINGTNTTGFSAVPSGMRGEYGQFLQVGLMTYFWGVGLCEVDDWQKEIHGFALPYLVMGIVAGAPLICHYRVVEGYSVRCIKD
jgi:uncharacterized protein (TIGR02145 family)